MKDMDKERIQDMVAAMGGKKRSKRYLDDDEYEKETGKRPEYDEDMGAEKKKKNSLMSHPMMNLVISLGGKKKK